MLHLNVPEENKFSRISRVFINFAKISFEKLANREIRRNLIFFPFLKTIYAI